MENLLSSDIRKTSPVERLRIPHESWTATAFWWKVYFRKWAQQYWKTKKEPFVAPKGPQQWAFPPPAPMLGKCVPSEWYEPESGWNMTMVSPPALDSAVSLSVSTCRVGGDLWLSASVHRLRRPQPNARFSIFTALGFKYRSHTFNGATYRTSPSCSTLRSWSYHTHSVQRIRGPRFVRLDRKLL